MDLKIHPQLRDKFSGLSAKISFIRGLEIKPSEPALESFKVNIISDTVAKWNLDELKENPVFRAYRDFFWKVGVDPTKIRPASEALIRRILRGGSIPTINTLVDAYNIASVNTCIPFGAFDTDRMTGELLMREGKTGEEFIGIGMDKPMILEGKEAVIQDATRLVAVYPYRDADYSKVASNTKNVLLMTCGVPGISQEMLTEAEKIGIDYITRFCHGSTW